MRGRKAAICWSFLLLGTGNVLFHVVKRTLGDSLLENQILQLVPIAVVLDASGYFTEAVQEDFIIAAVIFIIPRWKEQSLRVRGEQHKLNDLNSPQNLV